jgi:hypothetical protein
MKWLIARGAVRSDAPLQPGILRQNRSAAPATMTMKL